MKLSGYDAAGMATFGENLRRERRARQMTLEDLARRLGLGRAAPLSRLENSEHIPKPETIAEYAGAIGCTPADLLRGVLTPYDALRGSSVPLAPKAEDPIPISLRESLRDRATAARVEAFLRLPLATQELFLRVPLTLQDARALDASTSESQETRRTKPGPKKRPLA